MRFPHILAALALLTASFGPSPAAAQVRLSDPRDAPTTGRRIALGEEHQGMLTADDAMLEDETYVQGWTLAGTAGQTITIDLLAETFDPFVMFAGPGVDSVLHDDDGGGACNARLTVTPPRDGDYLIVVNTIEHQATGAYTLRVSDHPGPVSDAPCGTDAEDDLFTPDTAAAAGLPARGTFHVGETIDDSLTPRDMLLGTDGGPAQAWLLDGPRGGTATVDLLSEDFDGMLVALDPIVGAMIDDDGGGGCHARITVTFADDPVRIVVMAANPDGTGRYVLRASAIEPPLTPGICTAAAGLHNADLAALPVQGTLTIGGDVHGTLRDRDASFDGRPVQVFEIAGTAGTSVTVDVMSGDFDPFVFVGGPGLVAPLADDDGGGACNARLTLTFPATATYRLLVAPIEPDGRGTFLVRASAQPGAVAPGTCSDE